MHAVTTITTIDAATSHETAGLAWGILLMQQMLVFALCQWDVQMQYRVWALDQQQSQMPFISSPPDAEAANSPAV